MKPVKLYFIVLCFCFSNALAADDHSVILKVKDRAHQSFRLSILITGKLFEPEVLTPSYSTEEILSDSTYLLKIDDVTTPEFASISGLEVILTPGDRLDVLVEKDPLTQKDRFIFHGKNEENYNYNTLLRRRENDNIVVKKIQQVLNQAQLIKIVDSIYQQNISAINNFSKKYNNIRLKSILLENEKAKSYYFLFFGLNTLNKQSIAINGDNIKAKYFKDMFFNKDPLLMSSREYTYSMITSVYTLNLLKNGANSLSLKNTDLISAHYTSALQEYLQANNFYYTVRKMGGAPSDEVKIVYDRLHATIKDADYQHFIECGYINHNKGNKPFPEEVLVEKIYNYNGTPTTFRAILDKYKGKVIIIDNWANWCSACKQAMTDHKEITAKLKESGVQFIYLSLDIATDTDKMKQVAKEYNIIEDTYRVDKDFKSLYTKYTEIKSIPRYLLIDKAGNIKKFYLRNPSDPAISAELNAP